MSEFCLSQSFVFLGIQSAQKCRKRIFRDSPNKGVFGHPLHEPSAGPPSSPFRGLHLGPLDSHFCQREVISRNKHLRGSAPPGSISHVHSPRRGGLSLNLANATETDLEGGIRRHFDEILGVFVPFLLISSAFLV
jgi:hypothetical protein